ncbi:endonuclease domain-containing protein [Telluribacter sp.]|jgi:very-short-patch-repair endonuclease|uniref:endonuclease domain-containing protein n=1 Tax=Telluribacter sp. TaxID=1978767 RepID=UPI002E0E026E|nr:endonuclease domain-containing protein [Telluribacter sp.]
MKIYYNPKLKELARQLRNNATKSEIRLWQYLKRDQMGYDFHRQKPIGNYIADFFCHELMLVIEIDGYSHSFEEVATNDLRKEEACQKLGLKVLRFDDREVMNNMNGVLKAIENYIADFEERKL